MTIAERIESFRRTFPKRQAAWPWLVQEGGRDVLYARWMTGRDYRNRSTFYGSYPRGYLADVLALFPDVPAIEDEETTTLHVFSGSLPAGPYTRCDLVQDAEIRASVYDLDPLDHGMYRLVLADPPYSREHAKRYGTPAVDRRRAMQAIARVTEPGGHCVWLDWCWPMYRKTEWRTVGRIALTRSTNQHTRDITIFERVAA